MNNLNLIRKIAWSFHTTTGMDWEELFQEGVLSYLKASHNYSPDKGLPSTFLYHQVCNSLRCYIERWERTQGPLCFPENPVEEGYEEEPLFDRLNENGRRLAQFVIDNAERYSCMTPIDERTELHTQASRIRSRIFRDAEQIMRPEEIIEGAVNLMRTLC